MLLVSFCSLSLSLSLLRLRISLISYIWRVIKCYLQLQLQLHATPRADDGWLDVWCLSQKQNIK